MPDMVAAGGGNNSLLPFDSARLDPARIEKDIERIATFSETPPEVGYSRPTFSSPWGAARDYVIDQVRSCGAAVRIDAFGNVHARPGDRTWEEPLWLCGSHIDSVPSGGKYDGVSGVVCALELLRVGAPLELVIFAEEEGTTFGLGMLGSRGWVGSVTAEDLDRVRNCRGESYLEAGRAYGVEATRMQSELIDPSRYLGFLEVHPEQGLSLWNRGVSAAAVNRINGRRQYRVLLEGQGNHAGSTRMQERHDALAGAARAITAVEELGQDLARRLDYTVMTVGRIDVATNAINVIARRVDFSVDFRAQEERILEEGDRLLREALREIGEARGLAVTVERTEKHSPVPLDEDLVARLHGAAGAAGITLEEVPSGALHDAAIVAPHVPTAMVFIASREGISHDPAEYSRVKDIADATTLIGRVLAGEGGALTLRELNSLDRNRFVRICGGFYENSPWIVEKVWEQRPFPTVEALHRACSTVVEGADEEAQVALIRAHPDLVGRLAREGGLTRESTAEQAAAGLDVVSEAEARNFERLNREYRDRFEFPFVICARENRKEAILAAFPERLRKSRREEIGTALREIGKIALLRMHDRVTESGPTGGTP
ncbi:MAG: 2-oxo-4-hydroxy-4-carboxy-5-ureidoimidazoline decarboxylase [Spirochaetaceae bacterium]|nr:MAG: 2-oxo-4-hydroxy-4-carboxy-5-ureidoimidazoline decarboxylase [Spirochaetaceae bacterium]